MDQKHNPIEITNHFKGIWYVQVPIAKDQARIKESLGNGDGVL